MVRMEDCSPNVVALLPRIEKIAPRLVVKLSPLFDVDEVFRIFGPHTRTEVVSLDGECKELVADVVFASQADPVLCAVAAGSGEFTADPAQRTPEVAEEPFEPERYRWLVIPDVALQKARLARRYLSGRGVWIDSDNGYGFATENPEAPMCRTIGIESMGPFDPKALKRRLKAQNTKSIDIFKRNFPLSAAEIARRSGVREGGTQRIAFTRADGRLWQIYLTNL